MSQRTVAVVLKAQIENYRSQMKEAERHTRDVERAAMTATQRFREHNEALTSMGRGFALAGAGALASVALVAKATAEYGAKMAQLKSLSHATSSEMVALSEAAMTQGQAFGQSATQVADAEIELTKAGRSAAQIMGGDLRGALALAAAGQLDVGKATQIGVTALTQFSAQGATIPHVADLLAAGADKALGSVEDLGMALNQGGLVASQMGVSLDETTGTLAAFAQAGLLGSDAGTSMKTMLLALQSPSQQAAEYLKEYNIHAYDAEGHFVGMAGLAGQLKAGFKGVSDAERDAAMSTIFGTDAIRSANVLYKEGATGIKGWTKDVNAQGFAAAQAAGKMNSLQGDLTKLSSAFETTLIKAGTSADGGFRGVVQTATTAVQALGDVPAPLKSGAVAAGVLTAGVGLLGGAFLVAVPKVAAFRTGLEKLNVSGSQAAGLFGKGAGILTGITAAAAGLAAAGQHGMAGAEDMAKATDTISGGFKNLDAQFKGDFFTNIQSARQALSQSYGADSSDAGIAKALKTWTFGLVHFSDVWEANEAKFNAFGQQLSSMSSSGDYAGATRGFNQLIKSMGGGKDVLHELQGATKDYREQIINLLHENRIQVTEQNILNAERGRGVAGAKLLAAAEEKAKAAAEHQAEGVATLAGKARGATGDLGDLEKAIEGFGSAQLDARSATAAMEQAIADATKKIANNKKGIDLHTQAGRDNDEVLRNIASSTAQAAGKTLALTGSADKAAAKMKEGRAGFILAAAAAGIVGDKAQRLADKYGLIPENVKTAVTVTGADDALTKIGTVIGKLRGLNGSSATVAVHYQADGSAFRVHVGAGAVPVLEKASGGAIEGPGQQGVDSVPAMLAPGEHVLTTRDVALLGGQGGAYRFRAALERGDVQAFAKGGAVKRRRGSLTPIAAKKPKKPTGFGGIFDQTRKATSAKAHMAGELDTYHAQTRRLARANRAESSAQKAYDAIGSGKKDRTRKRAAKATLDSAKKRVASLEKAHAKTKDAYEGAKSDRNDANAAAADIRLGREDFISAERRDPNRRSTDPLAYVDQLRSMSRDENFSPTRRKAMDKAANDYEKTLVTLTANSAKAAEKLSNLKESSQQLHDSIKSAVAGGFTASGASSAVQASGWVTRNGMRFQSYTTGPTASGLASYYTAGASKAKRFADDLKKLTGKGYPDALVAEVAGYGVEAGQPIVTALLAATAAQRAAISSGYTSIGTAADRAGTTIADDSYKAQITAAKADADAIQKTITEDGEKLRKLIATAFGLKGYATGTSSATAGIRWVGEDGPELVGFGGGEAVLNRAASAAWVRGSAGSGTAGGSDPVVVQAAPFPDTITVQDLQGFKATMRVVATQVVDARHDQIAVRLMGASA